jgi:hypothetical protein
MTSDRKIAANRRNGRKSRGPRGAAGKRIASRNALRHGLTAVVHGKPVSNYESERFAKALCDDDNDPALFEQGLVIAKEEFVLRAVNAQQIVAIERLRDPSTVALAKRDNSLKLAKARGRESEKAYKELISLRDSLMEKYKDELPPPPADHEYDLFPPQLQAVLRKKVEAAANGQGPTEAPADKVEQSVYERDESAALEEAAIDLLRLDRYERRARSRQNRAILAFMNLKLLNALRTKQ